MTASQSQSMDNESKQLTTTVDNNHNNRRRSISSSSISLPALTSSQSSAYPSSTSKSVIMPSSSSSSSSSSLSSSRRTVILRVCFITSLVAAAVVCGIVAHTVMSNLELEVGEQLYEEVAVCALEGAQTILQRKLQAGTVMASILGQAFPNASQWPFVALNSFEMVAQELATLSVSISQSVSVIVQPEQVTDFEAFARNVYREHGYPETAGYNDFGFGIWKHANDKENPEFSDGRMHDNNGATSYGSSWNVLAPIFLHNNRSAPTLLFNIHSVPPQGHAMDWMKACTEEHVVTNTTTTTTTTNKLATPPKFDVVTDFVPTIIQMGPTGILLQPVYPTNDPTTVVAIVLNSLPWEHVLTNVVPDYVDGLDCVISTQTASYTFVIEKGKPVLKGKGDWHDHHFDHYARNITLHHPQSILKLSATSATYSLTVYPTRRMLQVFSTNSPNVVSGGFVSIILICIVLFFLYDFVMKYEAHQRRQLLDMKRRFVRFISHELRTPLNCVCMGLEILQDDLRQHAVSHRQAAGRRNHSLSRQNQGKNSSGSSGSSSIDGSSHHHTRCTLESDLVLRARCNNSLSLSLSRHQRSLSGSMDGSSSHHTRCTTHSESDMRLKQNGFNNWNDKPNAIVRAPSSSKGSDLGSSSHHHHHHVNQDSMMMMDSLMLTPSQHRACAAFVDTCVDLASDVYENTKNAVAVLDDLLNYDKIQTGTLKVEVEKVRIWELVRKTIVQFKLQAQNKRISLHTCIDTGTAHESMDATASAAAAFDEMHDDSDDDVIEFHFDQESGDMMAAQQSQQQLYALGDDMKLSQALRNLISNALKFTPEGGTVTVSATYQRDGLPKAKSLEAAAFAAYAQSGSVCISVHDTGAGMSLEQLKLLFQEWVQFDANKLQKGGGSGLGLCITKEIIEQHGGTVVAKSAGLGKGSTFIMELPLYEFPCIHGQNTNEYATGSESHVIESDEENIRPMDGEVATSSMATTSNIVASAAAPPKLTQHRILVVEDVISNRTLLVRLLERAGHLCGVASNGQEAIDCYLADQGAASAAAAETSSSFMSNTSPYTPFDTILMDSEMPVLTGPEATRRLRELGCTAAIIGVTGNVLPADVQFFKSQGADEVLPKPVEIALIEDFWANHNMNRQG